MLFMTAAAAVRALNSPASPLTIFHPSRRRVLFSPHITHQSLTRRAEGRTDADGTQCSREICESSEKL